MWNVEFWCKFHKQIKEAKAELLRAIKKDSNSDQVRAVRDRLNLLLA